MATVICPQCGRVYPDGPLGPVCPQCGAERPAVAAESPQSVEPISAGEAPASPAPAGPVRLSLARRLLVGGVAFLAVVMAAIGLLYLFSPGTLGRGRAPATATSRPLVFPSVAFPTAPPTATAEASPTAESGGAAPINTNGPLIAYARRDGSNLEVYVMNADGSNPRNLSNSPGLDDQPAFSPDGQQIVFISDRGGRGNTQLWLINVDGSNLRQLTKGNAYDLNPSWSPDGKHIAFESNGTGNFQVYTLELERLLVKRLTSHPTANEGYPAYSPDGSLISFNSDRDGGGFSRIYLMSADGGEPRLIDATRRQGQFAAWSPDGLQLCFSSVRSGALELWLINADGGNLRPLTQDGKQAWLPSWTPDGLHLVFTSTREDNDEEIWSVQVDGLNFQRLTRHPDRDYQPKARPQPPAQR